MTDYPERVCPVCGLAFTPKHMRQIYDKDYCRVKANRESKKSIKQPEETNWMLEEIRRVDAIAAADILDMAKMLAKVQAERLIQTSYRLLNRGGIVQAKNVLLQAGEITQVKRKTKSAGKGTIDELNAKLARVTALAGYFVEREAGKGLFLRRMNGSQKETKAFLGTFAKAEKWINETVSSGKPNYAALRTN